MGTQIVMLPPEALLATENIRFGLKKYRVESLANSILELGGVQTALKIEPLVEAGPNGESYVIREGHYRQAAALKLNKEGGNIQLPCEVVEPTTGIERKKYQISENTDRENLSPMDMAVAIKDLLADGMSKVEIRKLFVRPGGRKGLAMQPMSNSMLNIYVSFLEFPKPIQAKIHDGILPVGAAYTLSKKPKDKWEDIIAQAEAERQDFEDMIEKDEEKFLESERKAEEAKAKQEEAEKALTEAQNKAQELETLVQEKVKTAAEKYSELNTLKVSPKKTEKEKREAAEEALKAAEAEAKKAEKLANEAKREAEKQQAKIEKGKQLAAERAKKLELARKEAAKKGSIKKEAIEKAAAKVEGNGKVKLNSTDMRKVVEMLCLPGSFPKVQKIGESLKRCFDSDITDTQLLSEIAYLTGERKEKPKTLK